LPACHRWRKNEIYSNILCIDKVTYRIQKNSFLCIRNRLIWIKEKRNFFRVRPSCTFVFIYVTRTLIIGDMKFIKMWNKASLEEVIKRGIEGSNAKESSRAGEQSFY